MAKAGLINGREYTFFREVDLNEMPDFEGGLYAGSGAIRDGNILTSGVCPYAAQFEDVQDGTVDLTQLLIDAIKST